MKHKKLLCLALIFVIALSVFAVLTHFINASAAPILSVVPIGASGATSTTILPTQAIGTNVSVEVRVDDYASVNLGSTGEPNGVDECSYAVTWNPAVLNFTTYSDVSWLPDQQNFGDVVTSSGTASGTLSIGQTYFDTSDPSITAASATGSVSCTIVFQVLAAGSSNITLSPSGAGVPYLYAPELTGAGTWYPTEVPGVTVVNALYGSSTSPTPSPSPSPTPSPSSSPTPSPTPSPVPSSSPTPTPTPSGTTHPPTAVISIANGTIFQTGEQIVLDGASSTSGYDANSGDSCPITTWDWLVQYENLTAFGAYSSALASILVNNPTWLQITLIVTAPDVGITVNPQYTNTSTTSVWIHVETPQQVNKIVVFTNKGGEEPGTSGGFFTPQEQVQLYAYVTTLSAPDSDENVAFTVTSPNGTIIAIRSAFTNSTGYASVNYVTPDIGTSNFGNWSCTASVEVSQVVISGTITYQYGSSPVAITISGITSPSSVARGSTGTITVTIQNPGQVSGEVAITIYDSNDVPIFSSQSALSNSETTATISVTITIPTWAFTGEATVYVNVLSAPAPGGVPLCPEQTANFQITS